MLKTLKTILIAVITLAVLLTVFLFATDNEHLIKAFRSTYMLGQTTSNINDKDSFATRVIEAGQVQPWRLHQNYLSKPLPEILKKQLLESHSAAYLLIHNGSIVSEHYFNGYSNRSKTNSFSMAKTVVTLLTQIAIQEGIITSWEQSIVDYLPELSNDKYAKDVSLKNLSAMDSGLEWDESYSSVTSITTKLYYGNDVEQLMLNVPFTQPPNTVQYYSSGSTQLLGMVLSRALKQKFGNGYELSQYLSDKLWKPLGMNDDALWHLDDDNGLELVYCCLNTNARNYAKLGQLLLADGSWNGIQLINSEFIAKAITAGLNPRYGLSIWLGDYKEEDGSEGRYFSFNGHLGQYIIVVPERDMVVVRLGEKRLQGQTAKTDVPFYIEQSLALLSF